MGLSSIYSKCVREMCRRISPVSERFGFVLSPTHFYFPVPDTRDMIGRDVWSHRSALAGIEWNEENQREYINKLGQFGDECSWADSPLEPSAGYCAGAPSFGFSSAMLAHGAIRHFSPKKVIEVGCGWSTLVMLEALALNDTPCELTGIDPYPPEWLSIHESSGRIRKEQVQSVPFEVFAELASGDILFIDSSHVINTGNDVSYLYLEVLPRLKPGVVVHIHDIQLPFEYPKEYAISQRWFWNEQYLLQAFLQFNDDFEVLAAGHWLCREKKEWLKTSFPNYVPETHSPTGSFWMRRCSA